MGLSYLLLIDNNSGRKLFSSKSEMCQTGGKKQAAWERSWGKDIWASKDWNEK